MSIQIIDGFQVNIASPIDNRIVASGSAARNDIPYKYHGLRVFDISNNIPYVWNGSSWISENASGIVGSGTLYYFPIFSSSNVITNSLLFEYNGLIRTADNGNGPNLVQIDPEYGTISAQGGFYGPGYGITNINAAQISTGNLSLSRLTNGSTNWVLTGAVGSPTYSNPSQMTVGTASVAVNALSASASSQVSIAGTDTSATERYLTFIDTLNTNNTVKANTNLRFKPSTGQLLINSGSYSAPGIGIIGTTNTGIYKYSTSGLGVTVAGATSATFNTDGIRHVNTTFSSGGSFVVSPGTATISTQITYGSATFDRVIYMYPSGNSNTFYISAGWFQIDVYISQGIFNQAIYSAFFGSDSSIKSLNVNHSFILPAGLSCTIRLTKNGLTYNAGGGPTIYATSLKFGL